MRAPRAKRQADAPIPCRRNLPGLPARGVAVRRLTSVLLALFVLVSSTLASGAAAGVDPRSKRPPASDASPGSDRHVLLPVRTTAAPLRVATFGGCALNRSHAGQRDTVKVRGRMTAPPLSKPSGGRVELKILARSGAVIAVSRPEVFYIGEGSYFFSLSATYQGTRHPAACLIQWMAPGTG